MNPVTNVERLFYYSYKSGTASIHPRLFFQETGVFLGSVNGREFNGTSTVITLRREA